MYMYWLLISKNYRFIWKFMKRLILKFGSVIIILMYNDLSEMLFYSNVILCVLVLLCDLI